MPNILLFLLPFFLLLIVRKMKPAVFVALLILYASADYAYFAKRGFLVKSYAAPFEKMANVILDNSKGQNAIVAVDSYNPDQYLLLNLLDDNVRGIYLDEEVSAHKMLEEARNGSLKSSVIWLWRHTKDTSPGSFVTKLEQDLSVGREVRRYEFVPYSLPERWARRLLWGAGQPESYYRLSEFRRVRSDERPGTPN